MVVPGSRVHGQGKGPSEGKLASPISFSKIIEKQDEFARGILGDRILVKVINGTHYYHLLSDQRLQGVKQIHKYKDLRQCASSHLIQ